MRAWREGDVARQKLGLLRARAESLPVEQHQEKFAIYEQGRALAAQLKESWWEMFFEHWKLETLLFLKQDAKSALDLAVRAALEVRKTKYDGLPQRVVLQLNLVSAYTHIDPIGYESKVREAFNYLRPLCDKNSSYRPYFAQQWALFLQAVDDADALEAAWHHLARASETRSGHYILFALLNVCSALYQFKPDEARQQLAELAQNAEILGRDEARISSVATAQMWQAVAARFASDEDSAQKLYKRALATEKRASPPRTSVHFAAIAFHEISEDWEAAIRACNRGIRVFQAFEMDFREAEFRWKKCQLLQKNGRDWLQEAALLKIVAQKLPSKAHWEAKIESLKAG